MRQKSPAAIISELFASLIAFRVLYYFLPFIIGGLAFLGLVIRQNIHRRQEAPEAVQEVESADS